MFSDQEINEMVARKLGATRAGQRKSTFTGKDIQLWDWHGFDLKAGWFFGPSPMVDFCGDIKMAWAILGNQDFMLRHDNNKWHCWFNHKKNNVEEATASMAICLAFLSLK